jgi:hypothetical protein
MHAMWRENDKFEVKHLLMNDTWFASKTQTDG